MEKNTRSYRYKNVKAMNKIRFVLLLLLLFSCKAQLKEGVKAPDFTAIDQNGKTHSLKDYRGKYVLLYFYPKDMTPGCTKEACGFRDNLDNLKKDNVVVLGVSADNVESHKKFAEKYHLNFPILADDKKEIISKYKVNSALGLAKRVSFLINPEGVIVKVFDKVNPETHPKEVEEAVKKFLNDR